MRASYPRAIAWLAMNCDPACLDEAADKVLPAEFALVIDLWDRSARQVLANVRTARAELLGEVAK